MKKMASNSLGTALAVGAIVTLGGCAAAGGGVFTMGMLGMSLSILLTLVGCTSSHSAGPEDLDGDGHTSDVDCDDTNSSIHPGADEYCESGCGSYGDGIDNNCDGVIDEPEACVIFNCFPEDLDGDGWYSYDDCDDSNPDIHPGADEQCGSGCDEYGDGVDNNCDGVVDEPEACVIFNCFPEDLDGDGWYAYDDCNDEDPSVHPDAPELCGDAVDNNCDSAIDEDPCLAPESPAG